MEEYDSSDHAPGSARRAVLIVDDEVTFRRSLAEGISLLSGDRYQPVCVGSVDQALALLRNRQFAALVTDIRMPGKDGLQLLLEMKRHSIRVPTLVTTAYGSPAVHAQAARSGAIRYIEKPFPLEQLIDFLDGVMESASAGRVKTLDLIEVVEMLCMGGRDIRVGVRTRDLQGSIFIKSGEIVHAVVGDRTGGDVLLELLALPQSQISTDPGEEPPAVTINQPWRELTEEAWRRRTLALPPRPLVAPTPVLTRQEEAPAERAIDEYPEESGSGTEVAQEAPAPAEHPGPQTEPFWASVAMGDLAARLGSALGLIRAPVTVRLDDAEHAGVLLVIQGSDRVGSALGAGALLGAVVKTADATMVYAPTGEFLATKAICVGPSLPERRLYGLAKGLCPSGLGPADTTRWRSLTKEENQEQGGTNGAP